MDDEDVQDALISIDTEGGVTWSLRGALAEKYSFRDDLVFEYGRKGQVGGNRTNALYLVFGIGEKKLETRMGLRFLKEALYELMVKRCVDSGLMAPSPAPKRRK